MIIIKWLRAAWLWFVSTDCVECEKRFLHKHTYDRPFFDGRYCGACWNKVRREEREEYEQKLLNDETARQRRILLARSRAEKELQDERQPYREEHP